jgi:nucleoside-diphosphate-sugar epimerase
VSQTLLVTGGSGFIGTHLCKQAIEHGDRVINLDVAPRRGPLAWLLGPLGDAIVYEPGAAENWPLLLDVVKRHRPTRIAHLAAIVDVSILHRSPRAGLDMLSATLNVLEAARLFDVERVVNFSSIGVLPTRKYEPIDVDHPVLLGREGPASGVYGAAKLSAEAFCWAYRESYGLDFVTIRPSAAYGFVSGNDVYLNTLLEAALRREPAHLPLGAEMPRDYTHVHDIAGITLAALDAPAARLRNRVFYAASGMNPLVTAAQAAELVRQMVPTADISIGAGLGAMDRMELRMRGVLDVAPVGEELGYHIRYPRLREGVIEHADRYCEWLVAQGRRPAPRAF